MNTNSCPNHYATDQVMICDIIIPPPCNVNLDGYIAILSCFTLLRVFITWRQWTIWKSKQRIQQRAGTTALSTNTLRGKRKPVGVYLGVFQTLTFALFTALTATNIAGCINGISGPLYFIFWIPINLSSVLYFRRLTRLHRVLSPLTKMNMMNPETSSSGNNNEPQQQLNNNNNNGYSIEPDMILKVLNILGFIALAGFSIPWLLTPAFTEHELPLLIGMCFAGGYHISHSIAHMWQIQRFVLIAKKQLHATQMQRLGGNAAIAGDGKLANAIIRFRTQQFILFMFGIVPGIVWFLVGVSVIRFTYYVVLIHMSTEICAGFLFTVRFNRNKNNNNITSPLSSPQQINNNNNVENNNGFKSDIVSAVSGSVVTSNNNNNNNNNNNV
jgi:hypothetical protein